MSLNKKIVAITLSIIILSCGISTYAACNGKVSWYRRNNIPGELISSIPIHTTPDESGSYTKLEIDRNTGNDYGIMLEGKICPTETDDYYLYIASDDVGELRLSSDESKSNATKIAYNDRYTSSQQRTKFDSQESDPIHLVAGNEYYFKAIMKEDTILDNLAIGWKKTNASRWQGVDVIESQNIGQITPECGDGMVEAPEICDDGNTSNGDGCSDICEVEPTHICDGQSPTHCREKILQILGSGEYRKEERVSRTPQDVVVSANNVLRILDEKGDTNGRYITVSATDLQGTNYSIPKNNIQIQISQLNTISGVINSNIAIAASAQNFQSLSGPLTVVNKSAGVNNGGTGLYSVDSNIKITIPAYQNLDTYHSIITFTLFEI